MIDIWSLSCLFQDEDRAVKWLAGSVMLISLISGGEYVSKLEIPAVVAASAGLYLCFLATQQNLNSLGTVF